MPAVTKPQRRFFGWALHNPGEARAEGKYPSGMSQDQMRDFASTPEKGLPSEPKSHMAQGAPPIQRRFQWTGHDATGTGTESVSPKGHVLESTEHRFAKTTGTPQRDYLDDGAVSQDYLDDGKWIQGVTSSPTFKKGALTAQAHRVGQTPMAFAHAHYHDSGKTGARARFAVNAQK